MGYTHYWHRPSQLDPATFKKASEDIRTMAESLKAEGLPLAGPMGVDQPVIDELLISFNGKEGCGHTQRNLGIAWPDDSAKGVKAEGGQPVGTWMGGALVDSRTCSGDCSHESFVVEQTFSAGKYDRPDEDGRYFAFCKTAYKPYDLAVTAALIILHHHFGPQIKLESDGDNKDWKDGAERCQKLFGYGGDFRIAEDEVGWPC